VTDLQPAMKEAGYTSLTQSFKTNEDGTPHQQHSVATFWKSDRLRLKYHAHRSRTLTTVIQDINYHDALIAVVNCHLQGNPMDTVTRVKQLQTALSRSKRLSHHGLVVCGDMNCYLCDSACSTYLSSGTCRPPSKQGNEQVEWGFLPISKDIQDIPPHKYNLVSAYPPDLGLDDPSLHFTFCHSPHKPAVGIDQIWYTPSSLDCSGLRHTCKSEQHRLDILKSGLPNGFHPSDHMPVGCMLRWTKTDKDNDNGGLDLKDLKEDDHKIIITSSDPNELRAEANEWLSKCPFENEMQKKEFEYICSDVIIPGGGGRIKLRRGKPTQEQMKEIKEKRVRKENLLDALSEEGTFILKRVLRLLKEAVRREG